MAIKIPNYGNAMAQFEPDILQKLSPASKKLADLDIWERKLNQQFKDRIIGIEKYQETQETIDCARTKAIEKLERERGTYISPAMAARKLKAEEKEEADRLAYDNLVLSIREARRLSEERAYRDTLLGVLGFVGISGLVLLGIVISIYNPGIALLLLLGFCCYYFK